MLHHFYFSILLAHKRWFTKLKQENQSELSIRLISSSRWAAMDQGSSKRFDCKVEKKKTQCKQNGGIALDNWNQDNYPEEAWNVRYLFQGRLLQIGDALRNFPLD
jgi:hypothetical protein